MALPSQESSCCFAPSSPTIKLDNHIFASIHDIVGNQIPATVHFRVNALARQGGGPFYRAPAQQLLNTTFAADPLEQSVGPYANVDPGTELTDTRNEERGTWSAYNIDT
jgi:hypothetical protein